VNRQATVIFSQPKISYTAFPVLPNADTIYHYPHQLIPDPLGVDLGSSGRARQRVLRRNPAPLRAEGRRHEKV
jgi:hypothetical protein